MSAGNIFRIPSLMDKTLGSGPGNGGSIPPGCIINQPATICEQAIVL